jgi:biotin carboxylase
MSLRVLVVLPTETYRAADFVNAARATGVELAIASEATLPLVGSDRQVLIDCNDVRRSAEAIADLASTTPVDSIIAADDAGVEIAALASELIGLAASPVLSVHATLDKSLMRASLLAAEVAQPRFEVVDVGGAAAAAIRIGYPVVTKPRTRTASIGVVRSNDAHELEVATEIAERHQRADDGTATILVEQYLDGPEISLEGMLWAGVLETMAIFDKPDQPTGPFFPESIFVTPSKLNPSEVADVERTVQRATHAIGLTHGPVHAELRIVEGVPKVLEIAGRSIGGLCGRALTFGLMGDSMEALMIRQSLGLRKPGSSRQPGAAGVLMIPIKRSGTLAAVTGLDRAAETEGVWNVEMTVPIGSVVAAPPHGDRYLGFVFARSRGRETTLGALRTAASVIEVKIND